jgi:S-DNA-T family DNA segregation ATPase FtsK/SpoIIIE
MSFESTGVTNRKFESVSSGTAADFQLSGPLARVIGLAVMAVCLAGFVSLLTWSMSDPSLMHATPGQPRNLLGGPGAIVADLMMQTLGMGGVFALLPPTFWALQMITRACVPRFKSKLFFWPIAVAFLAAALSAAPTISAWPLRYGFGGIIGDLGLSLLSNLLSIVNAERASAAAGLFYCAGGMALLTAALGLSQNDLVTLLTPEQPDRTDGGHNFEGHSATPPRRGLLARMGGMFKSRRNAETRNDDPFSSAHLSRDGLPLTSPYGPGPSLSPIAPRPQQPVYQQAPPQPHWAAPQPQQMMPPPYQPRPVYQQPIVYVQTPVVVPAYQPQPVPQPVAATSQPMPQARPAAHAVDPIAREPQFDAVTDAASRSMAARFAPANAAASVSVAHADSGQKSGFVSGVISSLRRAPVEPSYQRPSLNLLKRSAAGKPRLEQMKVAQRGVARMLADVLADFGIKGEIKDIHPGPVVTLYEFEPARGTKSSRIIGLADDIARNMSASAVRVAVVPGRNVIGIELPNVKRETVFLREMVESDAFRTIDARLPVALGKTIGGDPIIADLARMPHLLVAGTTGSGKSVGVNAMILSLLYRLTPEECRFIMIDPKMLEFSVYNGIPHLLTPVVTDPQKAVAALNWVVGEMEERYKRMSKLNVRNIDVYNNRIKNSQKPSADGDSGVMPYIVVVVDEFADLMAVAGKEIEFAVQRLAQMARAAGIHLIMATQRPSVDIITGTIKANFPTRLSFRVASKIDSRTILNETGAEQLLGQGDMLYSGGTGAPQRLHGPFVSDEEVEAITTHLRSQGEPDYVMGVTTIPEENPGAATPDNAVAASEDDLYDRAVAIIIRDQKASTSYLQRRLQIGYNRAADLIERMEADGIVGPANHAGKRAILMNGSGQRASDDDLDMIA